MGEIRGVAAEVGVSPAAIDRAARQLPLESGSARQRWLGGPARVQLEVSLDRRGSAGLVGALGTIGAGFVIGVTGAIVEPTGAAAVVGLVAGIAGAAALVCRALWARSTAGHRRRPGRVADAVAALPPSEKPPEG